MPPCDDVALASSLLRPLSVLRELLEARASLLLPLLPLLLPLLLAAELLLLLWLLLLPMLVEVVDDSVELEAMLPMRAPASFDVAFCLFSCTEWWS